MASIHAKSVVLFLGLLAHWAEASSTMRLILIGTPRGHAMADPELEVFSQTGLDLLQLSANTCLRREIQIIRGNSRHLKKGRPKYGAVEVAISFIQMDDDGQPLVEVARSVSEDEVQEITAEWTQALQESGLTFFENAEVVCCIDLGEWE